MERSQRPLEYGEAVERFCEKEVDEDDDDVVFCGAGPLSTASHSSI